MQRLLEPSQNRQPFSRQLQLLPGYVTNESLVIVDKSHVVILYCFQTSPFHSIPFHPQCPTDNSSGAVRLVAGATHGNQNQGNGLRPGPGSGEGAEFLASSGETGSMPRASRNQVIGPRAGQADWVGDEEPVRR